MSSEKSSDHLSASCWEKALCWRIWLCGILCLQPSTHFNWSAKRLRNLYYHLIHFICIRFRSKTLLVLMDFKEIHIKANYNTHIQLFFPKSLSLIFFAFRISSFIQMTNESSQPTIADWGLTNCCDDAVIHNIHMLLVSLLPVELLLSSTLNPSSPGLNSCLLNWFQRRKEKVGTCTGKLNFLPPECELMLASALFSHSSLSHLRVLFNTIFSWIFGRIPQMQFVAVSRNLARCPHSPTSPLGISVTFCEEIMLAVLTLTSHVISHHQKEREDTKRLAIITWESSWAFSSLLDCASA